ncbi:retrovirus-related Pol polyprotein from transposon 412 [Trichonephila clavipes]|nr:retrovirus-related Pol polyprotein from transposon 412 [Trichonephila clavipes]
MQENDIIEPSSSPWASPIVLLKEALTSSPILIYPQPDKPFILTLPVPVMRVSEQYYLRNRWPGTSRIDDATRSLSDEKVREDQMADPDIKPLIEFVESSSNKPKVLKELHGSPTGGHFGVMKTLHRVRERFFWGKVRADVEQWCKSCDACAASRKGQRYVAEGSCMLQC